ncbi:MAG: hypothetical protein IIU35_03985 [Neisseriaceae bacterium]|nr:hypothetical protein [Neisseriaceae bacterium]
MFVFYFSGSLKAYIAIVSRATHTACNDELPAREVLSGCLKLFHLEISHFRPIYCLILII